MVKGKWIGEERITVEAGLVRNGDAVEFPESVAADFEAQGLFKVSPKDKAPKTVKQEDPNDVRSNN